MQIVKHKIKKISLKCYKIKIKRSKANKRAEGFVKKLRIQQKDKIL
jgi:hypothetical protein